LPTSAIEFTKYEPSQVALDFKAYPAWRKAWEALESPVHRGYHLFCLLTGCRPGEGSRIRLNDIDTDARMFVIRNAKAGKDINLLITPEIAFAISLRYGGLRPMVCCGNRCNTLQHDELKLLTLLPVKRSAPA
jgi:integrase